MSAKSDTSSLYFLANYDKYKVGKINLLSSKSSVLLCREKLKKILQLKENEKKSKEKINKSINQIKLKIHHLILSLPKTNELPKIETKKEKSKEVEVKKQTHHEEIRRELDEINQKIMELSGGVIQE